MSQSASIPEVSVEQLTAIRNGDLSTASEAVGLEPNITDTSTVAGSLLELLIGNADDINQSTIPMLPVSPTMSWTQSWLTGQC